MTEPDLDDHAIVVARAPGRVNLIGDHTDYTGGLVLPVAIDRWTVVRGRRRGSGVRLRSHGFPGAALVPAPGPPFPADAPSAHPDPAAPAWIRLVAAVVDEVDEVRRTAAPASSPVGFVGRARTTIPIGAGLSSSASFEVALALALGFSGDRVALAGAARRAEHRATGTPTGIMDQMVITHAVAGHALALDCATLAVQHVPLPSPEEAELVVVDSGVRHELATTAYGSRVAECAQAAATIGPLRAARPADVDALRDPVLRARARHVVAENARVGAAVEALLAGDLPMVGALLVEGHRSLRDDYAVSVPAVDELVDSLAVPGVFGARMTGGGFGGGVVALCRPGALDRWLADRPARPGTRAARRGWVVRAVGAADVVRRAP